MAFVCYYSVCYDSLIWPAVLFHCCFICMHLPLLPSHSLCCYGNFHEVDCIELALLSVGEARSDRIMIVMNTSVCKVIVRVTSNVRVHSEQHSHLHCSGAKVPYGVMYKQE